jgi:hypothetical protein
LNSASRYSELYGPLAYLPGAMMYWLFGNHLIAAKLPGFLSISAALWATYRICRQYAVRQEALIGTGCVALAILRWGAIGFWTKSDPLMLAGAALATLAVLRARPGLVVMINGLYFGLAPNMKISAFSYLIPLFVLIGLRRSWRLAFASCAVGAVVLPLPFLLPNASFANWLNMMHLASVGGMKLELFSRLAQYSILYLLPVLALVFVQYRAGVRFPAPSLVYLASLVLSMFLTCVLACRPGASAYHLLPYLPQIANLYFMLRSQLSPAKRDLALSHVAVPLAATLCFYAATSLVVTLKAFRFAPKGLQAIAEIRQAERRPGNPTVEVGYGDNFADPSTWYRYQTALDGQPYTIDGAAVRDHQIAGVEIPDSTIRYLRKCGTKIWLIPKGKEPFSTTNWYFTKEAHLAFDNEFRPTFFEHYQRTGSGEIYDIWSAIESRCESNPPAGLAATKK